MWVQGKLMAAALAAQWRRGSLCPRAARASRASRKRVNCSMVYSSLPSASEKWVNIPVTCKPGRAKSWHSSSSTCSLPPSLPQKKPRRLMPVSSLIWTLRDLPHSTALAERKRAVSRSPTAWITSYRSSRWAYSGRVLPRQRMGVLTPALRRGSASATQATANISHPSFSRRRETSTQPCP